MERVDVEHELARIDRELAGLAAALAPLSSGRPTAVIPRYSAGLHAHRPPAAAIFSLPVGVPAPAPSYEAAPPAAYGGAPAAARNTVAAYGTPAAVTVAAPQPAPVSIAQAASLPNGSPVLAAIQMLHPIVPVAHDIEREADEVDVPVLDAVRPRSHSDSGWVGMAIRRLAAYRPELAGRAILALLPLQGDVITDEVSYDLVVTGGMCYAVTVETEETSIHRVSIPRPLATIDARIEARLDALGAVPFRAPLRQLRRSDAFRINGRNRKKALAALKAVAIAPVSLREVRSAGVRLTDELILAIIAAGISPEWTIGHRFTIAVKIEDAAFDEPAELFIRVNDGAAVTLSRGLPLDLPSATLTCTSEELVNVLLGQSVGRHATLAGERAPVMLLQGWVARLESGRG